MAVALKNITAKILIQVGDAEPQQLGTVEIPLRLTVDGPPVSHLHAPSAWLRGDRGDPNDEPPATQDDPRLMANVPGYQGIPDDAWLTDDQVRERFPVTNTNL